ncbi:hypothetical protein Hypma_008121 [Hypsizygus marmoreus]|uniref:Integrase zinc-binding domain-containing protein n=1 Tax=Hypsizygus marmoreus TaxID=39966 RepID=A0A369JRU8_HYPMA|nr:hypothetical protein Hypma_008121 [Hypsizygus marmoreus]
MLKHVPATQFHGPDALSHRPVADGEEIKGDDDSWLDEIALMSTVYQSHKVPKFQFQKPIRLPYHRLVDIWHFLKTLEVPETEFLQAQKRFLKSTEDFFLKDIKEKQLMFRHNSNRIPALVVLDKKRKVTIMTMGHDNLQAVYELLKIHFYWLHMHTDIHHYVVSCHECQIYSTRRMELPLTILRPTSIFQKVYIDVMYMPLLGGKPSSHAARAFLEEDQMAHCHQYRDLHKSRCFRTSIKHLKYVY